MLKIQCTKGVIRRRKSKKDRQHNDKKTNNDRQNTTKKTMDSMTGAPLKTT